MLFELVLDKVYDVKLQDTAWIVMPDELIYIQFKTFLLCLG